MKTCLVCGSNFEPVIGHAWVQKYCSKKCHSKASRSGAYAVTHKEELEAYRKGYYHTKMLIAKAETIQAYGGKCRLCGESDPVVLVLHHDGGGGREHRSSVGNGSLGMHKWLKQHGYPSDIWLLCAHCHMRLHHKEAQDAGISGKTY